MKSGDRNPTRREFLEALARGAVYTAPVVTTFNVAPALLLQGQSSLHKKGGGHHAAPFQQAPPGLDRPSDRYRPPESPPGA